MRRGNYPIGVFDSGFGGISILKHIVRRLPKYDYLYFGDNARAPYGTRSPETVLSFTEEGVRFLFSKGCNLVVLACNTASSEALRKIQQGWLAKEFPHKRVLGVIIPTSEAAVSVSENGRIGVLATPGTVKSGSFEKELRKLDGRVKVFQSSAPLLVPFVEAGEEKSPALLPIIRKYVLPLVRRDVDTIVLGCTHYGILASRIRKSAGNNIFVLDEGPVVAKKLEEYFVRHPEMEEEVSKNGSVRFFSSDPTDAFVRFGSRFFGKEIHTEKIRLL